MTVIAARLSTALADRYRIERELGAGGMATVYRAGCQARPQGGVQGPQAAGDGELVAGRAAHVDRTEPVNLPNASSVHVTGTP
jgi:hypothetical protein